MKARRIKREYDSGGNILRRDLVFFGSYGVNADGTAKFYNENNKDDNFSEGAEAIADSLTVKLNILEGELWYKIDFGWPLWNKYKDKQMFDVYLSSVILRHASVNEIRNLSSKVVRLPSSENSYYSAEVLISSEFGEVSLNFMQQI